MRTDVGWLVVAVVVMVLGVAWWHAITSVAPRTRHTTVVVAP